VLLISTIIERKFYKIKSLSHAPGA